MVNTLLIFKSDSKALEDLSKFAREGNFNKYTVNMRSDYDIVEGTYRFARDINA